MAQLISPMDTVDVRACETHDLINHIQQELDNLKNENKLAKDQINTLESKEKYHRVLFFVYLLIICAGVAKYSGSVSVNELHSILQDLSLKVQRVEEKLDEVKLQIQKEKEALWKNIHEMHTILPYQTLKVQRLEADLDKVKLQIQKEKEALWKNIHEMHTILPHQTLKVQRLEADLDKIKLQTQKEKETLGKNINKMREKQTTGLGNMEKRMSEISKNVEKQSWGEFVWPISGWAAKMHSARTGGIQAILSDPFYSHKNGYKMRLSVWPDGYYAGKGTHLGVAFHLIHNEINDILTWPFKRPVTLSIINQHTGKDQFSDIILFDNTPNDNLWNKPTADRDRGLGTNKLISLTELSSNTELCQNDRIFIRCVVK